MKASLHRPEQVSAGSSLSAVFPSPAMARLVVFFAIHPGQRFHLRELMRRTRLGSASVQRDLDRLCGIGAVRRQAGPDGRVYLIMDEEHDAWRAWVLLLRSAVDPVDVLREALVDAEGLEGAFVFGSSARGDRRPESDVDLFLIAGNGKQSDAARRQLSEAEFLIGSSLDVVEYTAGAARGGSGSGNAFLERVIAEPKRWVYGTPETLGRLGSP